MALRPENLLIKRGLLNSLFNHLCKISFSLKFEIILLGEKPFLPFSKLFILWFEPGLGNCKGKADWAEQKKLVETKYS